MAFIHKVYLDGNLLNDEPGGLGALDSLQFDIIREGGVTSDSHILRQKTDLELTFFGDGYTYLCQKKRTNYCQDVEIKIYVECDTFRTLRYSGIIQLISTTADPTRQTIRTQIKDNSWSGLIKERENNKVFLTATKSATGSTITPCPSRLISFFSANGSYVFTDRRVWDVYEVLKWLIKQYSDDSVTVVSDYFTSGAGYHKYAITMGGMLYGGITWDGQNSLPKYFIPQVSFLQVFTELRKKLRLFMSVDVDAVGNPTIRIEPEAYFYSNTQLLDVDATPFELLEVYDKEQIFSEVKIGSNTTKVQDGAFYFYPKLLLDGWEEETYNNCSECIVENQLDLTSEWIIDSNVIHFTLNQDTSVDHAPDSNQNIANGDAVFLIETSSTTEQAERYEYGILNGTSQEAYHYNFLLQNDQVFQNWAGGIPECVAAYFADQCVDSCTPPLTINVPVQISSFVTAGLSLADNDDCLDTVKTDMDLSWEVPPDVRTRNISGTNGLNRDYYFVPISGLYRFTVEGNWNVTGTWTDIRLYLGVAIFNNSTVLESGADMSASLIQEILVESDFITVSGQSGTITIDTGVLELEAGAVVVFFRMADYTLFTGTYQFPDGVCVTLTEYLPTDSYNYVSDDFLRKPLIWEFPYTICEEDYQNMLQDKTGYILVNGKPGWIKEINYRPQKVSTLKLQATQTLCC